MTKLNLQSIFEEVRFNGFVNSLLKMNEQEIINVVSTLNEETKTRIITVLEGKLPTPKVPKIDVPDAKVEIDPEIRRNQQVIDIIKRSGGEASPELKASAAVPPRAATDVEPGSMRDRFAKGPASQPAADIKPGDMRSSFLNGPANDANVNKADAAFKDTSQAIGARRAAETSSSAIDMPKNNLGNISRNKTMDSNVKKVAAGLAGAGVLGGTAALIATSRNNTSSTQAEPPAASNLKPATVIPDKPKFEFGSKKGGVVSAAELGKYREYTGNKNVTLGQYMNARDNLTAKIGGKNDPQQIMKAKNLGAADVYRPDQIKAGKAQRFRPAGVSESLIDAFMKLQNEASATGNIFETAKKAKKDYDKDGKVESAKDEVWGSRFRAAKAAGKMQEESEAEKAKKKSMSHELDAPSSGGKAPETTTNPDWLKKKKESKVVQTGKNTSTAYKMEEDVEISEARESFTKGTRKIKSYSQGDYHAEVRHNPDWQEYQVHFYKGGKHMGEGPVSYHGDDKEDAHDSAKAGLEFLNKRQMSESVTFSDAELAHFASVVEMAPVPDDYSGAANGVSKRDLSDETVAENKKMNRIDLIKARLKSKK